MVNGGEPLRIESSRDPETAGGTSRGTARAPGSIRVRLAERFELCGSRPPCAHELHFVEHPLRVLMKQGKLHWPDGARRSVAAHERPAQQHVLGADEHGRALRRLQPTRSFHAAHQHVDVFRLGKPVFNVDFCRELAEPVPYRLGGLLDQRPHGKAPDEPARRSLRVSQSMSRPPERHGRRLARARRCDQDARPSVAR